MREFILEIRIIQNFILKFLLYVTRFSSIISTVAQWQGFGFACQRSPDQSPEQAHILFLYFIISFQTFTGSNPGLEGHFSAVFSGYGTYGKSFSLKFGLECDRCRVEESGGNMFHFRKGCVLINTKKGNFDFFKNGSFKIKNILTCH